MNVHSISSLKEKALYHVALNVSQDISFKEVAMCLEKPTYGFIVDIGGSPHFISDPEMLSFDNTLRHSRCSNPQNTAELWDVTIEEQCQRLVRAFPISFVHMLSVWINRFALEYLSYSQRQESLFAVSRYFLMDILTRDDWTEVGRLNEEKIAKRLLEDKRLTNVQKYRIACVYCFHSSIPQYWSKLTQAERRFFSEPHYEISSSLESLWYEYMDNHQNEDSALQEMWKSGADIAVHYGNKTALMFFWGKMCQSDRHSTVIDMASYAFENWRYAEILGTKRERLMSDDYRSSGDISDLNLPHYYSELLLFFLSEMCERDILTLFEETFEWESGRADGNISILECFLDWPLQDYFLRTINLLWGMIPKSKYAQCLFSIACKCNGEFKRYYFSTSLFAKIDFYDYGNMLWNLWKVTPAEYKNYVCYDTKLLNDMSSTLIKYVLLQLLIKDSFQNKDVALFKSIWLDVPKVIKETMIGVNTQHVDFFIHGDDFCWILLEKEKGSLVDWLLQTIFTDEEIHSYKKCLIESNVAYCFSKLKENCFKFVEDLINWCLLTDAEKTKFKNKLFIDDDRGLQLCSCILTKREFSRVDKMIDFCLSSEPMKHKFKVKCGEDACYILLNGLKWDNILMDEILTWCNKPEKEIPKFKNLMFSSEGISIHYELVFIHRNWENVKNFYKWFCLSPEEILKIKQETLLFPLSIAKNYEVLHKDIDEIEPSLRWCLIDEEKVINFKEKLKSNILKNKNVETKMKSLIDTIKGLNGLRKEVAHDVTNREDISVKDKGEKRFLVIEDRSSSTKRLRCET